VAFVKGWTEAVADHLIVLRQMDEGHDVVRLPLPGLITVVREVGEPRPPSLKGKMRAKGYKVPVAGIADLGLAESAVGLAGSFTQVVEVFAPSAAGSREMIPGPAAAAGRAVIDKLTAAKVVMVGN
jgi:electron transfer flavoprotein beta subunit